MIALIAPLPSSPIPATSSRAKRRTIVQELEERTSREDRRALEALLREHARAVADLCRYLIGPSEARNSAQEALEKIITSIEKFDPSKGTFQA